MGIKSDGRCHTERSGLGFFNVPFFLSSLSLFVFLGRKAWELLGQICSKGAACWAEWLCFSRPYLPNFLLWIWRLYLEYNVLKAPGRFLNLFMLHDT
jgi:hypothetical protein